MPVMVIENSMKQGKASKYRLKHLVGITPASMLVYDPVFVTVFASLAFFHDESVRSS